MQDSTRAQAPGRVTGHKGPPEVDWSTYASRFRQVRKRTRRLCGPLTVEDHVAQSMPLASPAKWHLAHTSWFFERFVLAEFDPEGFVPFDPGFEYLFNSYYDSVGERTPQADRGISTRPTVSRIYAYRDSVERRVLDLLEQRIPRAEHLAQVLELGLQHEQQHQELLVTDFKHLLGLHPLGPTYDSDCVVHSPKASPLRWIQGGEGIFVVGTDPNPDGFVFDNETPAHRVFLEPFLLASRPASNAEYLAFVRDGGYRRHEFWLSLGWQTVQRECWQHPLYWRKPKGGSGWREFTLAGIRDLDPEAPVCHLSYFEADAFARWSGARLPSEAEWESAAQDHAIGYAPASMHGAWTGETAPNPIHSLFRSVWQWTRSSYDAYPGYRPLPGALGEYNGKFMCNQYVLRGGSCATPPGHLRTTYRNFFPPHARWQFSGVRLAKDPE